VKFAIENRVAYGTAQFPNERVEAKPRAHMEIRNAYWKGRPLQDEIRIVCRGFCFIPFEATSARASSIILNFPAKFSPQSLFKALPYLLILSIESICLPCLYDRHSAFHFTEEQLVVGGGNDEWHQSTSKEQNKAKIVVPRETFGTVDITKVLGRLITEKSHVEQAILPLSIAMNRVTMATQKARL
jgi:hypothetical protein